MKRFLSLLIAFVMVLSMVPVVSFAAEERTVYVHAQAGSDSNSGLTEAEPVKTLATAYGKLSGADAGRIVFLGTTEFSGSYSAPQHTIPVTLTSKTGAEGFRSAFNVYFRGPTTLENMTVTNYSTNSYTLLTGGGHKFVIGEGVTSVAETEDCYFCPTGGSNTGTVASVDMTVLSGSWRNIYAVSHSTGTVTGDVSVRIANCHVVNSIATGYKSTVNGNVNMTITNTTVKTVYACCSYKTGIVNGAVTVTLGDGVKAASVLTDKSSLGAVTGGATFVIDGAQVDAFTRESQHSGTGETAVILKSGTVGTCVAAADTVSVDVPEGKKLTVTGKLAADTATAAGVVSFAGNASLTAAAVTDTLNCTVSGTVVPGHLYVEAPADAAVVFDKATGILPNNGQWTLNGMPVEDSFTGLVLLAKPDVTVKLYTGYEDGTLLTPDKTVTGELNAYYYDIAPGAYRYIVSGTGYYKIEKIVYMSEEEAATQTVVDATPPVKSGKGWEQTSTVQQYSDEILNGVQKSDPALWPQHADVFTTPWFTVERTEHQMTTQDQMEAFIDKLDDENDNLYVYNAGHSSGYGYPIDAIVVTKTDLSGTASLEEAAAKLDATKPTVLYRAHMHGSEPASGEAALAILQRLDGSLGDAVLDEINVVLIPRNNPDGARDYIRNGVHETDPNGDLLNMAFSETDAYMRVYNLFLPELVLDGHEYTTNITQSSVTHADAMIGLGFTLENSDAFRDAYRPMDKLVRENLNDNGLYYTYYTSVVNHNGADTSRSFTSQQGTMFVLIESRGIRSGTTSYPRRIITHVIAFQTMLEYVANNADTIKSVVAAERQRIVELGKTYEAEDQILLELKKNADTSWSHPYTYGGQNGSMSNGTKTPTVWNEVVRSRTAPTAYVIPAGKSYTDQVLALMDKHEITYTYIPAGSQVALQQYYGTVSDGTVSNATLGEEELVTFGSGAYVFCKNQFKGNILSAMMEPDIVECSSSSFAGRGILPNSNGKFPLYRYIHDLTADGFIEYAVTEVQPVEITVYLDGTNGLDTNDGLTEASAVKTLAQAYSTLAESMELAPAGSQASLKLKGLYDLGTARMAFPAVGFPVTISGVTVNDGFTYTGGSSQEQRIIDISGDTTFQYMTIHSNSSGNYNHINGNGHKLVMGEGLNCTTKGTNRYFILAGGSYSTTTAASTDLTVRSGKWRTIYAGGYLGGVKGLAEADISGCWVYLNIAASYRGSVGSVDMKISNVTVSEGDGTSAIHAGGLNQKNAAQPIVSGDVTITLGENVTAQAVYATGRAGMVKGTVTIVAAGADLSQLPVYAQYPDATGTAAAALLKLNADVTQDVTLNAALPLDLNGFDITGNVTVDGTLTVYDSATDDYDVSDGKYGEITGTVTGTLAPKDGYIAAAKGFHKFGGQYISGVSLRPRNAGIYYTATFLADEVLLSQLETGVAVSLADMPGADFETDEDTLYTVGTTGVMIENILTGDTEDADRAIMDIYAASYVKLPDGTVQVSDAEIAYSLYDILLILKEQNKEAFQSFVTTHNIQNWF